MKLLPTEFIASTWQRPLSQCSIREGRKVIQFKLNIYCIQQMGDVFVQIDFYNVLSSERKARYTQIVIAAET